MGYGAESFFSFSFFFRQGPVSFCGALAKRNVREKWGRLTKEMRNFFSSSAAAAATATAAAVVTV
jgi:hypothetical protein